MKQIFLSAILFSSVSALAGTFSLSCDEVRTAACNMGLDNVVACTATDGVNNFQQYAQNDNSCTLTNKLEEQVCNLGLNPATFQVNCVYR